MRTIGLRQSVVTRLVACLIAGGVVLSVGLSLMVLDQRRASLRLDLSQHVLRTARSLQHTVRSADRLAAPQGLDDLLTMFTDDPRLRAARLLGPGPHLTSTANWPDPMPAELEVWTLDSGAGQSRQGVSLDSMTLVRAPFRSGRDLLVLELLVDGPTAYRRTLDSIQGQLKAEWLLLAVMTLMGLLLVRRWFAGPLADVMALVRAGAAASRFHLLGREHRGEFGLLSTAIGGMVDRLDQAAEQLRRREAAFEDLYQFAPAAMLSLDCAGRIIEANRRAAQLLGMSHERELLGQAAMEFVPGPDRSLLRQTIDRLETDAAARCELRVSRAGDHREIDVLVECTGVRDESDRLQHVRLSMLDVSPERNLRRELADKGRLMNLVIDHMSDAILLVDPRGRVAAYNQQLLALLHARPGQIAGQKYDVEQFWSALNIREPDAFVARMKQIEADTSRPAQERFETRSGTFLFEGIPVNDVMGQSMCRLWVVQEITLQEHSQRLVQQQNEHLEAVRRLGPALGDAVDAHDLLTKAAELLFEVFGVEAVGLAIRSDRPGRRCEQVLHRGTGGYLIGQHQAVIQAVATHLMPQVMAGSHVTLWSELHPSLPWARPFTSAGLTSVAAAPLRGSVDASGILWIARRGGEWLDRHHVHLLETVAPVLAARLELAQLREQLSRADLTDPVTDLPNGRRLHEEAIRLQNHPGQRWSAIILNVDGFRRFNDTAGHGGGDQFLRELGRRLSRMVRRSCTVARLEGPAFGILCPDTTLAQADALAERLHQAMAEASPGLVAGWRWVPTASVGLASSPNDGIAADQVLATAHARATRSRMDGGNRTTATDPPAQSATVTG